MPNPWKLPLVSALLVLIVVACTSPKRYGRKPPRDYRDWQNSRSEYSGVQRTPSSLLREVGLVKDYVTNGRYGRRKHRPMRPRYITIHSTQNYTGDAWAHARALKRGKLRGGRTGYLIWHYTVQQDVAIQHMPTNEQGEHADFDGPGNNYSIGIEMCEHRGNSLTATIDRTAKLTAYLMKRHRIPLQNVVPHYHWPRYQYSVPHKNCPHFLLDNGRPGPRWRRFLNQVNRYYRTVS